MFVAGWRAADDAERLAERDRLDLSMLAATQADHIFGEAFFEIELMSTPLLDGATAQDGCLSAVDDFGPMLDGANFSRALFVLDCNGGVVAAEPPDAADRLDRDVAGQLFDAAAGATDRYVSDSFILHSAGHAMGGLGLPLYGPDEIRLGTLVSLIDLEQHFSDELSGLAQRLGPSGHADLIGHDGMVLTSTVHELIATSGRHVDFYRDAVTAKRTSI